MRWKDGETEGSPPTEHRQGGGEGQEAENPTQRTFQNNQGRAFAAECKTCPELKYIGAVSPGFWIREMFSRIRMKMIFQIRIQAEF